METIDLLAFSMIPGLGPRSLRDMAGRGVLDDLFMHPDYAKARDCAQEESAAVARRGARLVGWDDDEYPVGLRNIYDPSPVLFVKGRLSRNESAVAVVGSRGASAAGCAVAHAMARDLAQAGLTVVSGLARGIDTAAHQGALQGEGRTVAVLGSGLDHIYPRENKPLSERIVQAGGALVSELPMGTSPQPGFFPRRNRIIAGWSRAVVVVEAAQKSGALLTARAAADEGRDVFAVPGHPAHPGAGGTNQLIRDGAALVRDAADVLSELGLDPLLVRPAPDASHDSLLRVMAADAPASLEEIQVRSGRTIPDVLGRLTELELAEKVRRLPGGLYVRNQ